MKKILLLSAILVSCLPLESSPESSSQQYVKIGEPKKGIASHYSIRTNGGVKTASGIPLRDDKLTAASLIFPLHSTVKVTNINNGKTAIVKITDTGPFATDNRGRAVRPLRKHPTRIIDVSQATAKKLGFHSNGLTKVKAQLIKYQE
jgi:rare lipoprotein A